MFKCVGHKSNQTIKGFISGLNGYFMRMESNGRYYHVRKDNYKHIKIESLLRKDTVTIFDGLSSKNTVAEIGIQSDEEAAITVAQSLYCLLKLAEFILTKLYCAISFQENILNLHLL